MRKASLESDGLNASLSGTVVSSTKGKIQLDLALSAAAEAAALREYLPPLPAKISGGSFRAQGKVGGAWLTEGGVSSSPLVLSGSLTGKLANVSMPEPPKEAATAKTKAPPPAALLPDWPAARKAKFGFDISVANFNRGKLSASGISAKGSLNQGAFVADVTVAENFRRQSQPQAGERHAAYSELLCAAAPLQKEWIFPRWPALSTLATPPS